MRERARHMARWVGETAIAAAARAGRLREALARRSREAALAAATLARRALFNLRRRWQGMTPPVFFVWSFGLLIAIGTFGLLLLPGLYTGARLSPLAALFTMTSAVCVTGLAVVDTATYFTFWGQLWILLFIQLGGIGVITITSAVIGMLGGRLSIRSELTGVATYRSDESPMWDLARQVTIFSLATEAIGALLLFPWFLARFSAREALWHAVFQSISAYCNAGFSTFTTSLEAFNRSLPVLLVISVLVVLGGVGYLSLRETWSWWRARPNPPVRARRPRLSVHTFAVLTTTTMLLFLGMGSYLIFEWNGVLHGMSVVERLSNGWFMSVTARTAGFNSVPTGELGNDASFLTILLMLVGGSPGSAAGGLKTTTLAVLVALAWSRIRARAHAEIRGRGVPADTLERSVSLVLLALLVLMASIFALTALGKGELHQHIAFLPIVFEAVSAFCTVGLSMGITASLPATGQVVLIVLMFIGRVGLFAFFSALLLRRRRAPSYRPALEDLMVG